MSLEQELLKQRLEKIKEIERSLKNGHIPQTMGELTAMIEVIAALDPSLLSLLGGVFKEMRNTDKNGTEGIKSFVAAINGVSPFKIQQLINYTRELQ